MLVFYSYKHVVKKTMCNGFFYIIIYNYSWRKGNTGPFLMFPFHYSVMLLRMYYRSGRIKQVCSLSECITLLLFSFYLNVTFLP